MSVLVTGAAGQLGAAIVSLFSRDHEVVGVTRRELDLADSGAIRRLVDRVRPAVIINCAAYNNVDAAQVHQVEAMAVNALAVRALGRAAREMDATLVHYGTDFVFDGTATRPYREDDQPNPRSVYGISKLMGERFAEDAPRHYVLRVESLFGGHHRRSSVDKIVEALAAGREAQVFVDRTVSPTYVEDVARTTHALVARRVAPGLYHCVGEGLCSWHELGTEIARLLGVPARLVPVSMADVTLPAERPLYCALENAKLNALGLRMPSWQDALARYLRDDGTPAPAPHPEPDRA